MLSITEILSDLDVGDRLLPQSISALVVTRFDRHIRCPVITIKIGTWTCQATITLKQAQKMYL